MPNYEELIKQSQANVKALSKKLKELDKLHEDIKTLIKLPGTFDDKFKEIVELTENYTNTLGASTKKYLDGNNTLFTTRLSELSEKTKNLQKEISRLVDTDFTKLFLKLQKRFIDQTRKDLAEELKKIDHKSKELQNRIDKLKEEITRLEQIDLEKHFDKHQKTLSEIFGAINSINTILSRITNTLTGITQGIGTIQDLIDSKHKETKQQIESFSEKTTIHLTKQDEEAKKQNEHIETEIKSLIEKNFVLKREIKVNRIIQVVGLSIVLTVLIIVLIKQFIGN